MEDSKLIVTLIPVDTEKHAEAAFCLPHNKERHVSPTGWIPEGPTISSRDPTPAGDDDDLDQASGVADFNYSFTHRIRLDFDKGPENPEKGFSFGTSENCDVLLGYRGVATGISGTHFCITFDKNEHLILKDYSSTYGTAVSYNGQAEKEVRRNFTWILDLKKEDGSLFDVKVHIPQNGLAFKIQFASHETCEAEYAANLAKFLRTKCTALPPMHQLSMGNQPPTAGPSEPLTPRGYPVYINERLLGKGSFGTVDKVINVSDGAINARKTFLEPHWGGRDGRQTAEEWLEVKRRNKEEWLEVIGNEIRIMRNHPHERIVSVIKFQEKPTPYFLMDYFDLGNLEDFREANQVTVDENLVTILIQALEGLVHLHSRGVVHRDLKPANLLVTSENPFSIKIADFGLATDKPYFKTFCGTQLYAAPEIYLAKPYTPAVDLWSLATILLLLGYGHPQQRKMRRGKYKDRLSMTKACGLRWCEQVVEYANDWDSDGLIDLLKTGMLCIDPDERLSAADCLGRAYRLQPPQDDPVNSRSTTPTQRSALNDGIRRDDDTPTIVLGHLWGGNGDSNHELSQRRAASIHSSGNLSPSHLNNQSTNLLSYKRQRSPAINPAKQSFGDHKVKRHRRDVLRTSQTGSSVYIPSGQHPEYDYESVQFRSMYDAVLTLLADMHLKDSPSLVRDGHIVTLVESICEHLTRLNITGISYDQGPDNYSIILTSGCREILLASVTASELMSPAADLAAHLLHMLQLRSPATEMVDDLSI